MKFQQNKISTKNSRVIAASITIALLAGCADSGEQKEPEASTEKNVQTESVDKAQAQPDAAASSEAATTDATAKLNPAHGQPGHRCDIAVGAPLDSKPKQNVQPNLNVTPPPSQQQRTESPEEMLAKGLNPPHGSEGHDCAITVGAPLN